MYSTYEVEKIAQSKHTDRLNNAKLARLAGNTEPSQPVGKLVQLTLAILGIAAVLFNIF